MQEPEVPSDTAALAPVHTFVQRFSATRRGARLARLLAQHRFDVWGVPYGSDASETAGLVVAELAANAVLHGRVPGRDFRLALTLTPPHELLIELTDTRTDAHPPSHRRQLRDVQAESGRGLLLVDALTEAWGVRSRPEGRPGKTVWAVCRLTPEAPGNDRGGTTRPAERLSPEHRSNRGEHGGFRA